MYCGQRNQNIDMIIVLIVGWLNSSPVEIKKKLRHDL